jgi:hypothetical protein
VPYDIGSNDGGSLGVTAVVLGIFALAAAAIPWNGTPAAAYDTASGVLAGTGARRIRDGRG